MSAKKGGGGVGLVMDFKKQEVAHASIYISRDAVKEVNCFRFIGFTLSGQTTQQLSLKKLANAFVFSGV